uniref:Uncharacterized protein n=1 Tax=Arabidopsis thaliana TaxID=3702 RepID=Q940K4_ARATH|nr:Unknown protein [Arabidopsis thaliana]AAM10234.1 unknown protein [Arabidopsis thaliana]
MRRRFQRRR